MIEFYQFPPDKLKKLLADLDAAKRKGLSEDAAQKMYWGALTRWRDKRLVELAERTAPLMRSVLATRDRLVAEGRVEQVSDSITKIPANDEDALEQLLRAAAKDLGMGDAT